MSRLAVVGAGYVGVATAIALANHGHSVALTDKDSSKVQLLTKGRAPFYEKGIDRHLVALTKRGRIRAVLDTVAATRDSDVAFLCVGTPSREDGSIDTSQIASAARAVGDGLRRRTRQVVVVRSTVVPGTTESVVVPALEETSGLSAGDFGVCVNPEFLREGQALQDSLHPSHIVIGERDRRSGNTLARLYTPFRCPKLRTTIRVAEAIKYATNAFLATKVTFANEIANICSRLGLDADEVLGGMTLDPRISPHHLQPGVGFGGSCLAKDVRALLRAAKDADYHSELLAATLAVNDRQPLEAIRLLEKEVGPFEGKRIAILGLAFKPGTDDVRESRAIVLASELILRGARIAGYDPKAGERFAQALPGARIAKSVKEALEGADACIIQAAWPEFSRLGEKDFAPMKKRIVIDGRRTWPPHRVPKSLVYRRIG